jgi:predicted RecB family nuclease
MKTARERLAELDSRMIETIEALAAAKTAVAGLERGSALAAALVLQIKSMEDSLVTMEEYRELLLGAVAREAGEEWGRGR